MKKTFRQWNHNFTDSVRDLRRLLIKIFFGKPFRDRGPVSEIRSIVVLRMDRKLGDSVVATGFFRALHQGLPKAQITVLASRESEPIYRTLGFLNVIVVPKGMWPTIKAVWNLRKFVFDVLVETSHLISPKSIFLVGQIKAKRKIAFKNKQSELFSDHIEFDEDFDHVTARYQRTLAALGIQTDDLSYQIHLPEPVKANVDRQIQEELKGQRFIAINSFAAARMRNLTEASTRTLVEKLLTRFPNHLVVSIGTSGAMNGLKQWIKNSQLANWRVLQNSTEFFENARLIEKADVVISVDTAIVHVACAFKRPLVGLYRLEPKNVNRPAISWDPYGTNFEVIYSKPQPDEPEQDINNLDFDRVVDAVERLMPSAIESAPEKVISKNEPGHRL